MHIANQACSSQKAPVIQKMLLVMVTTTTPSTSTWETFLQELRRRRNDVGEVILVPRQGRALQLMGMAQQLAGHCQDDATLPDATFTVREPSDSHMAAKRALLAERPELEPHDVYVTFLN